MTVTIEGKMFGGYKKPDFTNKETGEVSKGKYIVQLMVEQKLKNDEVKSEQQYVEELLPLLREAVRIRVKNNTTSHGAFLSGGMDSSTMVGLMSPFVKGKIHTFSFRCKGKTFDESHYAKIISDTYNTEHQLVEFSPEEILNKVESNIRKKDTPDKLLRNFQKYFAQGKRSAAEDLARALISNYPSRPEGYYCMGMLIEGTNPLVASKFYRASLIFDEKYEPSRKRLETLEEGKR